MSSKSPVRSCDDCDETALSYAEIKALCAGNPQIREKMDLDIEVARLRLLKADHQSQHYRLEDNLLKYFPESVERTKGQIEGFKTDIKRLENGTWQGKDGFSPMQIHGVTYDDKGKAGAVLLETCKKITSTDPVKIGSYRGFDVNLSFDSFIKCYHLTLKGAMSYVADLGNDAFGNITRINNALSEMPGRLISSQAQLENYYHQIENAKDELQKPFPLEGQLAEKSARLAVLDSELNMEQRDDEPNPNMSIEDGHNVTVPVNYDREAISAKSKPSIIDTLRKTQESLCGTRDRPEKVTEASL